MIRSKTLRAASLLGAVGLLAGCASAANPWTGHGPEAAAKARSMDPAAVCPVVLQNHTQATLDASYEVVGMRFDLGLLPSGQSASFNVHCQAGRVRALAVSHSLGTEEPQELFQRMARLDQVIVTRVSLTQADRVR